MEFVPFSNSQIDHDPMCKAWGALHKQTTLFAVGLWQLGGMYVSLLQSQTATCAVVYCHVVVFTLVTLGCSPDFDLVIPSRLIFMDNRQFKG